MSVSKENLLEVIDLFESLSVPYWLYGGWGVDILCGRQTREHNDIDILFDSSSTAYILSELKAFGYKIQVNQLPIRITLFHTDLGLLDIHPFSISNTIKQDTTDGSTYKLSIEHFSEALFEGRSVPCISIKGQYVLLNNNEQGKHFKHDTNVLKSIR